MSIASKLKTIAENEIKVHKAGQVDILKESKYMNATANGEIISITDVSPVEHSVGVKLASKNLIKFSDYVFAGCINNGDGTISASISNAYYCRMSTGALNDLFFNNRGKKFTFSVKEVPADTLLRVVIYGTRPVTNQYRQYSGAMGSRSMTFTVDTDFESITSVDFRMLQKDDARYDDTTNVISDIQLEFGDIATDYTPYVDDFSQVTVKRYGKNLLPYPYTYGTRTDNGVSYTVNEDNSITLNGTSTAVRYFNLIGMSASSTASLPLQFKKGEKYRMSTDNILPTSGDVSFGIFFYKADGTTITSYNLYGKEALTMTVPKEAENVFSFIRVAKDAVFDNFTIYPQIEYGTTATPYEPYVEPTTYTVDAEGMVEGVKSLSSSMTLLTETDGVTIACSYLRDIDTYINNLMTDTAMSIEG